MTGTLYFMIMIHFVWVYVEFWQPPEAGMKRCEGINRCDGRGEVEAEGEATRRREGDKEGGKQGEGGLTKRNDV